MSSDKNTECSETETVSIENFKLVFSVFKDEFEREQDRSERLNNRIGILLATYVATLTVALQLFDLETLLDVQVDHLKSLIVGLIPIILILCSMVLIILSCKGLLDIITPKRYISINHMHVKDFITSDIAKIYEELFKTYIEAINNNTAITDTRMKDFCKYIRHIVYSIALLFMGYISIVFTR